MSTGITIDDLHEIIISNLKSAFTNIITVDDYNAPRKKLEVPALLIELEDLERFEEQPGTAQLSMLCNFQARVILPFTSENVRREIRKLATSVAVYIEGQRWIEGCGVASVTSISQDAFTPHQDQFEVWSIEWSQEIWLGEPIWKNDGNIPAEVLASWSPEIGPDNEPEYTPIEDTAQ